MNRKQEKNVQLFFIIGAILLILMYIVIIPIRIVLYIWTLPQNIIGVLVMLGVYIKHKVNGNSMMIENGQAGRVIIGFTSDKVGSFSLGHFVFYNTTLNRTLENIENMKNHELGHSLQSLILGPLYLPVVGLSSLILNIQARWNNNIYENYYDCFPENWADKLGKVKRTTRVRYK